MSKQKEVTIKRGLDINISGRADRDMHHESKPSRCAVTPDDYPGFIPKLDVKEGDYVFAGGAVLHDKIHEDIKVVAPVSGKVVTIRRGERRKIEQVVIAADSDNAASHKNDLINIGTREGISRLLQVSGLWVMMRQRPFDIVPDPAKTPRDIFVTGFDSAPLAPDFEALLTGKIDAVTAGLNVLAKLTDGNVYVGLSPSQKYTMESLASATVSGNVVIVSVKGPHPAGNAGIQAANLCPVNKGEVVWTTDLLTVSRIGHLMQTGVVAMDTIVAVTGPEVKNPCYVSTVMGADVLSVIKGNIAETEYNRRYISGNVLTGKKIEPDGYLRYPCHQITVIREGDDVDEFMGWASLGVNKMSVSRSFLGHFLRGKRFVPDARLHGSRRAMIMSGEYDKVLPMDIMAEYLLKAIISRNIEDMESLGIYEVAPEDMALCEYVDTSKLEIQKLVREGLDFLRKEIE